jgi:hypothetical protein
MGQFIGSSFSGAPRGLTLPVTRKPLCTQKGTTMGLV